MKIQEVHLNYVNMPTISPRDRNRESKISVGKDERRKGLSKLFT